jgi:predicted nucleic acid-binding Zn ribbon protein
METSTTSCQVCGKALAGRSDKKFCSDQCRAQLNNKKKKSDAGELFIQDINRILRKNRGILKSLSPMDRTTTRKEYLVLLGFNFSYFTQQLCTEKGNKYNFCYEYGYLLLPEEKVLIINRRTCLKQ